MKKVTIGYAPNERTYELGIGDLLLILHNSRGTHRLGVIQEIRKSDETIYFNNDEMMLRAPVKIEGFGLGGVALAPRWGGVDIEKIRELYQDPENIAKYLRELGWNEHADWVEKLPAKNATLPSLRSMFYLDRPVSRVV